MTTVEVAILASGVTVAVAAVAWAIKESSGAAKYGAETNNLKSDVVEVKGEIEKQEMRLDIISAGNAALTTSVAVVNQKLDTLKEDIGEIKVILRKGINNIK